MSELVGGAGIVRAIEVNVGSGLQFFEAAGPNGASDSVSAGINSHLKAAVLEEARRGARVQSVLELETAWKGWGNFEDGLGLCFQDARVDAAVLHGFPVDAKNLRWLYDWTAEILGASENHLTNFRALLGEDNRNSRLQDSGFFACDFLEGVAEKVFVIEIDAGEDGDKRWQNV